MATRKTAKKTTTAAAKGVAKKTAAKGAKRSTTVKAKGVATKAKRVVKRATRAKAPATVTNVITGHIEMSNAISDAVKNSLGIGPRANPTHILPIQTGETGYGHKWDEGVSKLRISGALPYVSLKFKLWYDPQYGEYMTVHGSDEIMGVMLDPAGNGTPEDAEAIMTKISGLPTEQLTSGTLSNIGAKIAADYGLDNYPPQTIGYPCHNQPFKIESLNDAIAVEHEELVCGETGCAQGDVDGRVKHPSHYNAHPSGVEAIDIIQHFTFNVGNAVKYLWRMGLKDYENSTKVETKIRELQKAREYIDFEIAKLEKFGV